MFRSVTMKMLIPVVVIVFCFSTIAAHATPKEKEVREAMRKASAFMMDTVSYRGGFVWKYSADLSRFWGEVPARETQIWVQGATNGVGEMFLMAWCATGDDIYLEYAKRVANAIVWGQYPEGGWHYLIDFDMDGIQKWYDEIASRCWGWEEYYHFYGNCTFDDDTTQSATRFLLHLYTETLDPTYLPPLLKALDFILEAQFPNGAWPQRYPLSNEFSHDGVDDYTSYYTYNDNAIGNCIWTLWEAAELLGDKRYREAALRGMYFYIISQFGRPQAGWAQQYTHDMLPGQARGYEPAGINSNNTTNNINHLQRFYLMTGDRRFLNPIPAAIDWLEDSVLNTDPAQGYTHTRVYEYKTNRPIYFHRAGTNIDNGHYYWDYEFGNFVCHMESIVTINVEALYEEYNRITALSPEEALAEYEDWKRAHTVPAPASSELIESIIDGLDDRGAWVTDVTLSNYKDPCSEEPPNVIRGIATRTFISNMNALISYFNDK